MVPGQGSSQAGTKSVYAMIMARFHFSAVSPSPKAEPSAPRVKRPGNLAAGVLAGALIAIGVNIISYAVSPILVLGGGLVSGIAAGAIARGVRRGTVAGFLGGFTGGIATIWLVTSVLVSGPVYFDVYFNDALRFGMGAIAGILGGGIGGAARGRS